MTKPLTQINTPNDVAMLKCKPILTAKEYGLLFGVSELTARRWAYSGQVESLKIGRSLRLYNTLTN